MFLELKPSTYGFTIQPELFISRLYASVKSLCLDSPATVVLADSLASKIVIWQRSTNDEKTVFALGDHDKQCCSIVAPVAGEWAV